MREVDLAEAGESVQVAAQRMAARSVGTLLVLDESRRPAGVLTDRDIALRVAAAGRDAATVTVEEIMSRDPHSVNASTPIEDCLRVMRRHAVRRLPVTDDEGRLVGILSMDDVLALLAEEMAQLEKLLERSSPEALRRR